MARPTGRSLAERHAAGSRRLGKVRIKLAWLAIVLLALSVAAPVVEAFEDCQVVCASSSDDDCGTPACCSCCPAARFVTAAVDATDAPLEVASQPIFVLQAALRDAEPRGILHVPKPLAA